MTTKAATKATKTKEPAAILPKMIVVQDDPADQVRMLLDELGGATGVPGDSIMARCVAIFEQHGEISDHGYTLRKDVGPLAWRSLVAISRVFDSNAQWLVGDLAAAGVMRWDGVSAVDARGDVPLGAESEDAAYNAEDVEVVAFSVDQALAALGRAKQTIHNWTSCCRRFPNDPSSILFRGRPEWRGALFTHFVTVMARDLPPELVAEWLTRAAAPKSEGGWSTEDLIRARDRYRKERDGDIAAEDGDGTIETTDAGKVYIGVREARSRYRNRVGKYIQARVPDINDVQAKMAAEAAITWIYADAPPDFLESAANWSGGADDDDTGGVA